VTWLIVIAVLVIGVPTVAVVTGTVVGMFLPRDHVAQVAVTLAAGRERVWALVSDFPGSARWRPDMKIEMQPAVEGHVRFAETTRQGRVLFEVVSQEAPARQVVRVVDQVAFGGTWTWELAPGDSAAGGRGTRLTITEDGFVKIPVFRVMSRLFFSPTASINTYLRALAKELGEGAEPVVVRER
jgi:uncharacterized protein YndB with AHSA1/START domain